MDADLKQRREQVAVWSLVGLSAALAALPRPLAASLGLDTDYFLGVFALLVFLALFLFARFSYIFLTVLLIVGANLPDAWTSGIDKTPLIVALAVMIVGSVLNHVTRIIPTGLEPKVRRRNPEAIRALVTAIERGQERGVKTVMGMGIELDDVDDSGRSPLMAAAAAGQVRILKLLLAGGANPAFRAADGSTAADHATRAGFAELAALLRGLEAKAPPAATATPDLPRRIEQSQL